MKTLLALWQREARGAASALFVVVVGVVALDALLLAWGNASGNTTAFDRLFTTFAPATLIFAGVVGVRVFGGENEKGTWALLAALPIPPRRVLLAKLAFVVFVLVVVGVARAVAHAVFDAPAPSQALAVRAVLRAALFSAFAATLTSTLALLGRRFVMVGLVLLVGVPALASLLSLRPLKDGPFGLVAAVAAVDDVSFGGKDAVVCVVVVSVFVVVFVLFGGKDLAALKGLALPWSSRATRLFAIALGMLMPLEVSPLAGPPDLVPAHLHKGPGRVVFVDDGGVRPLPAPAAAGDAGVQALQNVVDLVVRHGQHPRVLLVRRDSLPDPVNVDGYGDAADDDALIVVEARKDATDHDAALALALHLFDRGENAVTGAGVAVVVAARVATSPTRVVGLPRLLRAADLDHSDVFVAEVGEDAAIAAAGFFVDDASRGRDFGAFVDAALDHEADDDILDAVSVDRDAVFASATPRTLTPPLDVDVDVVAASAAPDERVRGVVVHGPKGLTDVRVRASLQDVLDRPRAAWRSRRDVDGAALVKGVRVDAGFVSGDVVVVEVSAVDGVGALRSSGRRRLVIP